MCNLESLSLIDMKLFLFSATIQAIYLNHTSTGQVNIEPFWLQTNLCNPKQLAWWTNCTRYLFSRRSLSKYANSSPQQLKKDQTPLTVESLEANFRLSIDIKRQIELAKVIELLRLKNTIVKCLDMDSQETEKYQVNLNLFNTIFMIIFRIPDKR